LRIVERRGGSVAGSTREKIAGFKIELGESRAAISALDLAVSHAGEAQLLEQLNRRDLADVGFEKVGGVHCFSSVGAAKQTSLIMVERLFYRASPQLPSGL
jgi:hypothetical protein